MSLPSYVQQILESHSNGSLASGRHFKLNFDYILAHDATFSLIIDEIERLRLDDFKKDSLMLVADHFIPPATIDRANILNKFMDYAKKNKILNTILFEGICHQILVEHPNIFPGQIILGADSHTVTASALGCIAFGLGSYDILYALSTGHTMFKFEKIVRIILEGDLPDLISGKDIVLHLIGIVGEDGGNDVIWEIVDRTKQGLTQDDRFAFSNMCVEAGAISAVFIPDRITAEYLKKVKGQNYKIPAYQYSESENTIEINVANLKPHVAKPHSPANVVNIDEVLGKRITQVYIGSCASGRLSDIAKVAQIIKGKKVKEYLKAILVPSSVRIYREALSHGYIDTIIESGFIIGFPSCGPCGKIDKGVLGDDDVCLSTSNRNYQGRMGSLSAEIYLASPQVCAASALEGTICCP